MSCLTVDACTDLELIAYSIIFGEFLKQLAISYNGEIDSRKISYLIASLKLYRC